MAEDDEPLSPYPYCNVPNPLRSGSRPTANVPERTIAEKRAEWVALGGAPIMPPKPPTVPAPPVAEPLPTGPRKRGRPRKVRPLESQPPTPKPPAKRFGEGGRYYSYRALETWKFFPRTVLFYQGPSQLTGEPIFAIAGASTSNRKTGPMVQIWIIRADMTPIEAVRSGGDTAICGACTHRGDGAGNARSCYVEWWRAPSNLYQAVTGTGKGTGKNVDRMQPFEFAALCTDKQLRIGAYGDPAAVPLSVWTPLLEAAAGWTAYTHQWRRDETQAYRTFCMASVDSEAEYLEATARGWRTFRVRRTADSPVLEQEIICPASEEAGHKVQCAACELCRGTNRPARSIVIAAHGQYALHFRRRAEA